MLCTSIMFASLTISMIHAQEKVTFTNTVYNENSEDKENYHTDILGENYLSRTITMPCDYDGKVICTLVRPRIQANGRKGILYVHGYNDYFFQTEMCEFFKENGWKFYAIDLRKYGRSILPGQYPFTVRNLQEYFPDIDSAIKIMKEEGCEDIVLLAHSTGGLISSLYCDYHKDNLPVKALALNSPFLDMNFGPGMEKMVIPIVSGFGKIFPKGKLYEDKNTAYAESLLSNHYGEWEFDTCWKYPIAPRLTMGWLRAIHKGHKKIKKGLDIPCPVWVAHSDKSIYGKYWTPQHQKGDAVLNVDDIEKYATHLGKNVRTATIEDGLHDLALSEEKIRSRFYEECLQFIESAISKQNEKE